MERERKKINRGLDSVYGLVALKNRIFKKKKTRGSINEYNFNKEIRDYSFRIAEYSEILAELMCLDKKRCKEVKRGAYLHDLGKTLINSEILKKKESLTDEEVEVLKNHTKLGLKILKDRDRSSVVENIVAYHHERWDGKGYPFKLKEREIPIEARIVSVADSYDALRNRKSYKRTLNHEEAIGVLKKFSGVYYDPDIIIMLEMFGEYFR